MAVPSKYEDLEDQVHGCIFMYSIENTNLNLHALEEQLLQGCH